MSDDGISIITPSFRRDLRLCRALNRSIIEFFPPEVRHYIIVDGCDVPIFRTLAGGRTDVIAKEDVLPSRFRRLPWLNRWRCSGTLLPITGWLVQQIAKIAMASLVEQPTLLMVDSDAVFVRDVDTRVFSREGKTRLFKNVGAVSSAMTSHIRWHATAARLLGTSVKLPPLDDYIGQVISWKRDLVLDMCRRIESNSHTNWVNALARARHVSEYLLYGVYVESVAQSADHIWIDEKSRCFSRWEYAPIVSEGVTDFVAALSEDDVAFMITAHSLIDPAVRDLIVERATRGRVPRLAIRK